MHYVFSTLTSDNRYAFYADGGADMKVQERTILIKGGTGIANDRLITPLGVATEVTAEEAEALKAHPLFQLHQKNGFVVIQDKKGDPEKVASGMEIADGSAPLTPSKYKRKSKDDPEALSVTTNSDE